MLEVLPSKFSKPYYNGPKKFSKPIWVFRRAQWSGKLLEAWFKVSTKLCLVVRSSLQLVNLCSISINVQEGAEMVGGRVMPCQRAGFGSGGEGTAPKAQQRPFFRELQFIQEVLSWQEQSFRSVKFQDKIGI